MPAVRYPRGLAAGGRALWRAVTKDHQLNASQLVQLEEACRAKDRLDRLDALLRGDVDTWTSIRLPVRDGEVLELHVHQALAQANATANLLKQLLAALRLPDEVTGRRPQARGGARGAYKPSGGKVSSLERARAAKSS